jgi:dTDP-4-dehydrorhamnose reductase
MLFVVGAGGMLARSVIDEFSARKIPLAYANRHAFDITDELGVWRYLNDAKPTVVVNCAAMTDVDLCEIKQDECEKINATGVRSLAKACKKIGARFIHMSTDYVFDGEKGFYTEQDACRPLQQYGNSKRTGEVYALEEGAIILRLQWLIGEKRYNFVDRVFSALVKEDRLKISTEQRGSLCSTSWVSQVIHRIYERPIGCGIYHLTHDTNSSRFEAACFIAEGLGKNPENYIEPASGLKWGNALRPANTIMNTQKIKKAIGWESLGRWEDDVATYVKNKYGATLFA